MSFQSNDSLIQDQQLKVQQLTVRFADVGLYSASGSTITVNLQQTLDSVVSAVFFDNSAGTNAMVTAANRSVSGSSVTLTLSAAFAANDVCIIQYIVQQ